MAFGAKVAAIEFAGDEIRVVVARTGGKRPHLLEAHASTAIYESSEQRPEALTRALDEVLAKIRYRPAAFVLCADSSRATVRTLTVPFKGAGRVAKAVPFELEPHLPFPLEELALDHQVIAEVGGETEVLAVGMRRMHLDEHLALLASAGIDTEAVSLDAAGLTALWRGGRKASKGLEAVLHLRENGSILAVTHGRTLAFFRYLPIGGNLFFENPARIAREVQNTLRSFLTQWRGGGEVTEISVTGVECSPDALAPFSQALGLPASPCDLLGSVRGGATVRQRDNEGARFNRWEAALGVAQTAAGSDFSFNLCRTESSWESSSGSLVAHLLFSACLGLVLVLCWGFYYHQQTARYERAKAAVRSEIEGMQGEIDKMATEGLGNDVDVTPFGDPPLLDLLKDVAARVPTGKATVTEIKVAPPGVQGPWITISGETPNAAEFNAVMEQLKKSTLYKIAEDANIKLQGEKTFFRVRAFRPNEEVVSNENKS